MKLIKVYPFACVKKWAPALKNRCSSGKPDDNASDKFLTSSTLIYVDKKAIYSNAKENGDGAGIWDEEGMESLHVNPGTQKSAR